MDQHVEGDEASALTWLLRADVERTSLLEDEARINAAMCAREASKGLAASGRGATAAATSAVSSPGGPGSSAVVESPEGGWDLSELKGVNLETALEECYERMAVIGQWVGRADALSCANTV